MSYQDAMLFLQNLPTKDWTDEDLELLLSKAWELKQLYHNNSRLGV
jgi:hypothetical protein